MVHLLCNRAWCFVLLLRGAALLAVLPQHRHRAIVGPHSSSTKHRVRLRQAEDRTGGVPPPRSSSSFLQGLGEVVEAQLLPSEQVMIEALEQRGYIVMVCRDGTERGMLSSSYGDLSAPSSGATTTTTTPRRRRNLHPESSSFEEVAKEDVNELAGMLINLFGAFVCVTTGALAAGLTLGLLGLDPLMLLIKQRAGETDEEKRMASQLLPIVKQHHRLLVTLLLMNASANEALPIFLEALVPPSVAILLSVTLVLFFGEIIPSAVFTGPDQLKFASRLCPLVKACMFVLYPIAGPIAKLLDLILHDDDEHEAYNRGELSALIRIQYEERLAAKRRLKKERALAREQLPRIVSANGDDENNTNNNNVGAPSPTELRDKLAYPSRVGALDFDPSDGRRLSAIVQEEVDLKAVKSHIAYQSAQKQERVLDRLPSWRADAMQWAASDDSCSSLVTGPTTDSIHADEVMIVEGALQMKTKVALDLMRPKRSTYRLPHDMKLNERNLVLIYSSGFSRIPIYRNADRDENNNPVDDKTSAICGVLITKQLIVVNPDDKRPLHTLPLYCPLVVGPRMRLVDLLNQLQTGGTGMKGGHLALVCADPHEAQQALDRGDPIPPTSGWMGIVTLEDVLEAVLQEHIYDEFDKQHYHTKQLGSMVWAAWTKYKLRQARKKSRANKRQVSFSRNAFPDPTSLLKPVTETTALL